ncbi:hypothetical protein SAMN05216223_104349 [Actinacidiphila yanglinensis]|uniref:WD40 repeat domain-containing protein n=1 Tax=Actinacidiphila yanglinensis TaxID=310779 RepID=A0A1H5Z8V6_9ACTN|nr:WD40 repeat domain-containing protein [Actinacidiphila yanglinensis]SEG32165.1 hypothetical protein SAMN05216223_104349 [Actinacidiphila yanglinensis]
MRTYLPVAAAGAVLALSCASTTPAIADSGPSAAFRISDPRITESSGLAASKLHPGVYWTHNDSGDGPYVYGVDAATGKTVATLTMRGIHPRDVEAISLGPDGDLYVADIGDNLDGAWSEVWIYRFPEPRNLTSQTVDVTRFTVRYDDGPRNAEALMVQPKTGRVYIASKNEKGGHLYEGPAQLSSTGVNVFKRIGDVPWVTDGAFSPDGSRLVLRGYLWAIDYRWVDGRPRKIDSLGLPIQPQGESVTFTPDGRSLLYGSEGKDSEVWKEGLSGDELPDSVTPVAHATPTPSATSPRPAADAGVKKADNSGGRTVGFIVLAAIAAAGYGLRRVARRRRG